MKKIITTVFCTAIALCSGLNVYAAEILERDYIEAEIWEEMWNGKGDNGLDFPEASYKHHLLDKWLDENYGSEDYDWTEIGELQYEYKDYYRHLIEDWDFEDDNEGGWTINTEDNHYSFFLLNGMWQMTDKNGDTVDSFPPFSTLEEDDPEIADGYEINDDGADSPRVIGKVTGGTKTTSEGGSSAEGNDTTVSPSDGSEGNSDGSGASSLAIIAGVTALAGVGGAATTLQERGSDFMIFQSKQKVNGAPIWEVDTDTQTVRHRNPKTGETERYVFHTDHIRYYLHHIEEKRPDLLQEIVDKGEIYKHLDDLDTKVTDAVNRQTELLMQSSRDYQVAVESGNLNAVGSIGNLLRMQAQRVVYDTMIYLWRDE